MTLSGIDAAVVLVYAVAIFALAQWVSRTRKGEQWGQDS
jgi:hypothetical protein